MTSIRKNVKSVQEWIPIERIFKNGNIELKTKEIIKILKVCPINYNLKTDFEKIAILNSYKIFLKTCQFDMQILIQSKKENLSSNISLVEEKKEKQDNTNLDLLYNDYIEFIKQLNHKENVSSKNYFILIKKSQGKEDRNEEFIFQELQEKYFKIKECLQRCGNIVTEINNSIEIEEVLYSFFNTRLDRKKI